MDELKGGVAQPPPPSLVLHRKRTWDERQSPLQFYEKYPKRSKEKYYGIVRNEHDQLIMGDKQVHVDGNDIVVDDVVYKGTPGLSSGHSLWKHIPHSTQTRTLKYINN